MHKINASTPFAPCATPPDPPESTYAPLGRSWLAKIQYPGYMLKKRSVGKDCLVVRVPSLTSFCFFSWQAQARSGGTPTCLRRPRAVAGPEQARRWQAIARQWGVAVRVWVGLQGDRTRPTPALQKRLKNQNALSPLFSYTANARIVYCKCQNRAFGMPTLWLILAFGVPHYGWCNAKMRCQNG